MALHPRCLIGREEADDFRDLFGTLNISDAKIMRRNYVYSIAKTLMSPAASAVAIELHATARTLVDSGEWQGVTLVPDRRAAPEYAQLAAE